MSVLNKMLADLDARGALAASPAASHASQAFSPAGADAAAAAMIKQVMPVRASTPRRGIARTAAWTLTISVVLVVAGTLAWMEYRAKNVMLSGKPRGIKEFSHALPPLDAPSAPLASAAPADGNLRNTPAGDGPAAQAAPAQAPAQTSFGLRTAALPPQEPATASSPAPVAAAAARPAAAPPAPASRPAPASASPWRADDPPSSRTVASGPPQSAPGSTQVSAVPAAAVRRSASSLADPNADLARAADLIARGRNTEAMPLLRDVLARDAKQHAARSALAALQAEAGQRRDALATLTDGVEADPLRFAVPAAQLQNELGDSLSALQTLQRVPPAARNGAFHALAGGIAASAGRHAEAVASYRQALGSPNPNPLWWIGLGLAHEAGGATAEARAAFARLAPVAALPDDVRLYVQQKLAELGGGTEPPPPMPR
jgi:tetratricopeptide (TPR) repeat protein